MSRSADIISNVKPGHHLVQLHSGDDQVLTRNIGQYIAGGLDHGDGILVVATEEHRRQFGIELSWLGCEPEKAIQEGRLVWLDARRTLSSLLVDGQLDWNRFEDGIEAVVRQLRTRSKSGGLRAYGEMVGLLWREGKPQVAMLLEKYWIKLLEHEDLNVMCGYPIDIFGAEFQIANVDGVLCTHTHLLCSGVNGHLEGAIERAMHEVLGPKVAGIRDLIKFNYRPSWAALPTPEAMILWVRNNLPDCADEVMNQARRHYWQLRYEMSMLTLDPELN